MKTEFKYGKIIAGDGTPERQELEIVDYARASFVNDRIISICKVENDNFVLAVENPSSSDRATQTTMYLTKESFFGLITTAIIYFEKKGEDINGMVDKTISDPEFYYSLSDNLIIGTEPKE